MFEYQALTLKRTYISQTDAATPASLQKVAHANA